jgi:6-phosphogluconolactonase (cycloisomerase 2 family)
VTATVNADGTLTQIESDPTGQAATCWIVRVGDRVYASNAGSGSLTGFNGDAAGHLTLIGNTSTGAGSVDAAATSDGRFIYVQTGLAGNVDGFSVNADGTLTAVGTVTVPDAVGGEGIVTV